MAASDNKQDRKSAGIKSAAYDSLRAGTGGWERWTPPVNPVEGFDWEKAQHLFEGDVERLGEVFEPAMRRIPSLENLGIRAFFNGPIPISPDGEPGAAAYTQLCNNMGGIEADITPDYNPIEAGLRFVIDWGKGDFLGAEALERVRVEGPKQNLVYLGLQEPLPLFGNEAIFVDGRPVGQTTSGNFGYSVGKSLVLGYVPSEMASAETFEIESFAKRTPATLIRGAAYDPGRMKILS